MYKRDSENSPASKRGRSTSQSKRTKTSSKQDRCFFIEMLLTSINTDDTVSTDSTDGTVHTDRRAKNVLN